MSVFQLQFQFRLKKKIISLLAIALFAFVAIGASAQVEKGVITGTIKEGTGALVQNAQVTLQNTATGRPTRRQPIVKASMYLLR